MSNRNSRDLPAADPQSTPLPSGPPSSSPATPAVPWSSVAVRTASPGLPAGREITGPDRLALLYLWYRDARPPQLASRVVGFHPARGAPLDSPRAVDWSGFPWADAVSSASALKKSSLRVPTPLAVKAQR